MINDILKDTENRMNLSIESLRTELSRIRTGKANISLLDGITVPYYGTPTPLNQVANISAPEPRLLTVQPWDKTVIGEIEKALQASDLGITPNNDGTVIRLPLPQLTQEVREDLAKQARKRGEDAKVSVRNIRRDANDQIKKLICRHPNIDSIIFSTDLLANAGVQAMMDAGVSVPDDIAVIGVDNSLYARLSRPQLTVLDNKMQELSIACSNILVHILNNEPAAHKMMILSEIIERDST